MQDNSLLALAGGEGRGPDDVLGGQSPIPYNAEEQQLSVLVQRNVDCLLDGRQDQLVLLKLYPLRAGDDPVLRGAWPGVNAGAIRREVAARMATDTLSFFGPLHGGIITQEAAGDVIVQERQFSTAYPHIRLERYDVYDAATREPLLGAWRARRMQNQRRATRTNRMIDIALLVLEVGKAAFPLLT